MAHSSGLLEYTAFNWFGATTLLALLTSFVTLVLPKRRLDRAVRYVHRQLSSYIDDYIYREIDEYIEGLEDNTLFTDVSLHLQAQLQHASVQTLQINDFTRRCTLIKARSQTSSYTPKLSSGEYIELYFDSKQQQMCTHTRHTSNCIKFVWVYVSSIRPQAGGVRTHWHDSSGSALKQQDEERRTFTLSCVKQNVQYLNTYIDFIQREAQEQRIRDNYIQIHTTRENRFNGRSPSWQGIKFQHNSTFESLCIDATLKQQLLADLNLFMSDKEFYVRTGKPNKRSYLLYGPPGTGKTSCVAAIARQYNFNIFDLDLGSVNNNNDLRGLMMKVPDRSIILMEDIDRQLPPEVIGKEKDEKAPPQRDPWGQPVKKISTSGLLNMLDGLWSGVAEQRIFIATSNHPDKLDAAILRSGRMDMKLQLGYANMGMLTALVRTHLDLPDFELTAGMQTAAEPVLAEDICPCDISEHLVRRRDLAVDVAVQETLMALKADVAAKKRQAELDAEKAKLKAQEEAEAAELAKAKASELANGVSKANGLSDKAEAAEQKPKN